MTGRTKAVLFGAIGLVALVVGISIDSAEANTNSLCSIYGSGPRPDTVPSVHACDNANALVGLALVLLAIGAVLVIAAAVIAIRGRSRPGAPTIGTAGWYPHGDSWAYWDGSAWRPDVAPPQADPKKEI